MTATTTVQYDQFQRWHINGKNMWDLGTTVTAGHWLERVRALRAEYDEDEDASDLYLSLAMDMFRTLGWLNSAVLADRLRDVLEHAYMNWDLDAWYWDNADLGKSTTREHKELFAELGWEQSSLLVSWFTSNDTVVRMRDWEYLHALALEQNAAKATPTPARTWPEDRLF